MNSIDFLVMHTGALLALVAAGTFGGILAGLLGVGGGIVIVPVLFFVFQSFGTSSESAMLVATATSLATIVPTSISSTRSHQQKGNVDFDLLKQWAPCILVGVLAGSWLMTRINGTWLTLLFGTIATLAALNMLLRSGKSALFDQLPGKAGQAAMGASIGFFSTLVGIGGGTLSVPFLTLYNYPAHKAVGTACAIGLMISLPSALTLLILGNTPSDAPAGTIGFVNLTGFFCIAPLTTLFAPVGALLANKLDPVKLKKVFAAVLLITGLRMLAELYS
jgi:uncharacterized protein